MAQHITLDTNPRNYDWGTFHAFGLSVQIAQIRFRIEYGLMWDVEPGWSGPLYYGGNMKLGLRLAQ
ncbi:MAG: hypothetical protein RL754_275 [Bacteroidota bacterium]|jgi:hypothetical protein